MRHLVTQNLTMLGTLVLIYWLIWKGGGVEKATCRFLAAIFFMIIVLKLVLLKRILEVICSYLHYTLLWLIFCYTAL